MRGDRVPVDQVTALPEGGKQSGNDISQGRHHAVRALGNRQPRELLTAAQIGGLTPVASPKAAMNSLILLGSPLLSFDPGHR